MSEEWLFVQGDDQLSSYSVFRPQINKCHADQREYHLIRLSNGLETLLVSDRASQLAAASLVIKVGFTDSPVSRPSSCSLPV